MNKIREIVSQNKCTGCCACIEGCPENAVSLATDKNGFRIPQITEEACISCHICEKICPAISYTNDHFPEPDVYAVRAADEVRMHASSGGVFTVIAEYILNEHGCCIGAGWETPTTVKHMAVFQKADLRKLQGSKYMQSNMSGCMRMVRMYLETGKRVLFTGTPCQVAGLHKFLGKTYPNLLTVDLICHGVPSDTAMEKYFVGISGGGIEKRSSASIFVKKNWAGVPVILKLNRKTASIQAVRRMTALKRHITIICA